MQWYLCGTRRHFVRLQFSSHRKTNETGKCQFGILAKPSTYSFRFKKVPEICLPILLFVFFSLNSYPQRLKGNRACASYDKIPIPLGYPNPLRNSHQPEREGNSFGPNLVEEEGEESQSKPDLRLFSLPRPAVAISPHLEKGENILYWSFGTGLSDGRRDFFPVIQTARGFIFFAVVSPSSSSSSATHFAFGIIRCSCSPIKKESVSCSLRPPGEIQAACIHSSQLLSE